MRVAVITVAGISNRFNVGIEEDRRCLKAIYMEKNASDTLLFHLIHKCSYADRIIVVGGYKFEDLEHYIAEQFPKEERKKIILHYNEHYADLASGYSLYLGLEAAFQLPDLEEILFVEGDLDIDDKSFEVAVNTPANVFAYHCSPVQANRDVLLYQDRKGIYKYLFSSEHGLLRIEEAFSSIYNSGQLWKFKDMEKLREAAKTFYEKDKGGTNLMIIQEYMNRIPKEKVEPVCLERWTNCNTREDFSKIQKYWEAER